MVVESEQTAFLDYFLDDRHTFDYAILIDAPWGSGKTHFLRRYLRDRYPQSGREPGSAPDFLWVSLFGRRDAAEVRDALFASAHPLVSSKWGALAGSVVSGVVKRFSGIDAGQGLLKDIVFDVKAKVVVFDDLERSSIKPKDALGLINGYVEDGAFKVIVIANQGPFATDSEYREQKEKVIGRTLRVMADSGAVLDAQIAELQHEGARDAVVANRADVLEIFRTSALHNLRSLRAALDDFERLVSNCDTRLAGSEAALRSLLLYLIAVGMEVRADKLRADQLGDLTASMRRLDFGREPSSSKVAARAISDKYRAVDWSNPVVPPELVAELITAGALQVAGIDEALAVHPLVVGTTVSPRWLRLWNWMSLSATQYGQLRSEVLNDLAARVFVHPGEILHIAGSLLQIEAMGDRPIADLEEFFRDYIDDIVARKTLSGDASVFDRIQSDGWSGHGYQGIDNPAFRSIRNHLEEAVRTVQSNDLAERAERLMNDLSRPGSEADLFEFDRAAGQVGGIPLLQNAAVIDFAGLLLVDWRYDDRLLAALHARYEAGRGFPALSMEGPWLRALAKILNGRVAGAPPPHAELLARRTEYWFGPMLANMDAIESMAGATPSQDAAKEAAAAQGD